MQEIEMLKIEEMIRSGVMNGIIFHFYYFDKFIFICYNDRRSHIYK